MTPSERLLLWVCIIAINVHSVAIIILGAKT